MYVCFCRLFKFVFFNDTATTEIYTLSLHDALPIWTPAPPFDPTFVVLAMIASVEAIFLSTFVLINQNRMAAMADKRADLDLQISLLAEHEITRLITLVTAIAARMGIEESRHPELAELSQDIAPDKVMDQIERQEKELE